MTARSSTLSQCAPGAADTGKCRVPHAKPSDTAARYARLVGVRPRSKLAASGTFWQQDRREGVRAGRAYRIRGRRRLPRLGRQGVRNTGTSRPACPISYTSSKTLLPDLAGAPRPAWGPWCIGVRGHRSGCHGAPEGRNGHPADREDTGRGGFDCAADQSRGGVAHATRATRAKLFCKVSARKLLKVPNYNATQTTIRDDSVRKRT
jgi:hypothetical protein